MLTVAKVTGVHAAGYADYLEGKTTASQAGDYYLKDGERVESPGRWIAGAEAVGADPAARVTGEQLRVLMEVRRPDTGRALRPVGATGEAVAALDATFSAPKSVSAVWALGDPDLRVRLEQAHETAIDRALTYATAQVPMLRERVDRQTVIHAKARDLVATGWRHTTARAVDGPPDPQLHTHVLLHGAVRRDGQVAAIDSRQWFTHRRELGAAYRTELARELTQLGFQIKRGTGRGGRYFEIDDIPTQLLDRWSSRHHQVQDAIQSRLDSRRHELEAIIDANGPDATQARERLAQLDAGAGLSAGEDRFLTATTRQAKQPTTRGDLDAHWAQTAGDLGVHRKEITHGPDGQRPAMVADGAAVEAALTEHDAMLTRSHARAIALEQSAGAPIRDALLTLAQLRDTKDLLTLADGSLTTRQHRDREDNTVATARRIAAGDVEPIPQPLIDRHAERLDRQLQEQGGRLSDEQRAALRLACGAGQLVMVEGQAGTGKSTVLTAVALAHQDAGQHIIVTSTAALTAQRLATELTTAGVNADAYSTVALQHAITDGRLTLDPGATVIHDEAALASTRELDQLLDSVENSGARLILVGDPRQSHAVGAGGLWPYLETATTENEAHVALTHNLRARDPDDARDQAHFRNQEPETALAGYANRGQVHLTTTQNDAEDNALEAAHQDQRNGQHALVIAQTSNDHLDELNARAQAIRHQHGQLGPDSLSLTGRPYPIRAGDPIQLRASLPHPDHGTLRNGTTATITTIDPDTQSAHLRLSDDREIVLDRDQLNQGQARLAYVQHPFPAQGTTSDTTHLIVADHPTQEGSYVALTRARHHTHIHAATTSHEPDASDLSQLAQRMSATDPDLPSITQPLAHEALVTIEIGHASASPRPRPPQQQRDRSPTASPTRVRSPSLDDYRTKYAIPDDDERPLGPEPPADAFRQRLDRRTASRAAIHELQHDPSPEADRTRRQLRQLQEPELEHEGVSIQLEP